jgi:hypothetical protein
LGFDPLVVPLPAQVVPLGFLPQATPTAAPRTALASSAAPTAVPDGPPPREWPASPIAYFRRLWQSTPMGTTPPPPLWPPPAGGQGVVVPVTSLTSSPIPSSVRAALADPNWRAAMEDEYGALMSNGT